jgi:hypothetical protein
MMTVTDHRKRTGWRVAGHFAIHHLAAAVGPLGQLWQERNSLSQGDELLDRPELQTRASDRRVAVVRPAEGQHLIRQAVHFSQKDEPLAGQIVQAHLRTTGQRMVRR